MKRLFTLSLLFYASICFGQEKMEYANFIQTDTSVKWAAIYNSYVNLTPANPNFNIRNFYINKLKKKDLTAYREDNSAFAVTPVTISYDQYRMSIRAVDYDAAKMNWGFRFDNKKNAAENIFTQETNNCDTCLLVNKLSLFKIKQLLYYKNHHFYIQNILLSPVIYKKVIQELKENTEYFETDNLLFNAGSAAGVTIPPTAKFIARSCNNLVLLPSSSSNTSESDILTKDNWNLTYLLYKDINSKAIRAYDPDKSIYPDPKNVLDHRKLDRYKNEPIIVATYDTNGVGQGGTSYKKVYREINFDSIYNFTLVQDLYFDFDKEILYSKPLALIPRISVITSQGINLGLTDYWGVIFPEEKMKLTRKTK